MPNKILGRLGLVLGGLCLGLLGAEGIARMIAPNQAADLLFNSSDASPMNLYVIDKETRLRPRENLDETINSLDYSVELKTNELGLRGPSIQEISQEQWIALGDSFTMSVQVNQEDSFSGILGKKRDVQVWNAGVDGFSTWQATLRMKQIAQKLPIKMAILTFFTGNDFQDNERFLAMRQQPLPGKDGEPIPRPSVSGLSLFLMRNSYIYAHYRIWEKQKQVLTGKDASRGNWQDELRIFSNQGEQRLRQLEMPTRQALEEFKRTAQQLNIIPLVLIAPPAFVIAQERAKPTFELVGLDPNTITPQAPQERLEKILKELHLPYCNLSPALQKAQSPYLVFDGHWSKEGHQVVADAINQCLENQ